MDWCGSCSGWRLHRRNACCAAPPPLTLTAAPHPLGQRAAVALGKQHETLSPKSCFFTSPLKVHPNIVEVVDAFEDNAYVRWARDDGVVGPEGENRLLRACSPSCKRPLGGLPRRTALP
jgi:hypothetical protein